MLIACINTFFLLRLNNILNVYIPIFYLFICNGYLCFFNPLAITNNDPVNMGVSMSLQTPAFNSFGCVYPEAELLDHMAKSFTPKSFNMHDL